MLLPDSLLNLGWNEYIYPLPSLEMDASFCQQRSLIQLYNVPLPRFTPANPYSSDKYSKFQLDMRRKAEVLKYSANRSSTQTNNPTKKQNFAALVRGKNSHSQSQIVLKPSNIILNKVTAISCTADDIIPTPTSSCGVPGPITYLYNDETVPLYNYSDFNTRTYSDHVPSKYDPWQFVSLPDQVVPNTAYYLIMNSKIRFSQYNYKLTVPVGIRVYGQVPPLFPGGNITIHLKPVTLSVYFGSNLVNPFSEDITDISLNLKVNANTSSSSVDFSGNQFVGNLIFENILLYTAPTYVYTFNLVADNPYSDSEIFKSAKLIANISPANYSLNGCSLVGPIAATNGGSSIQ